MNLRTYLVESDTTQAALAQKLGVTQSLIAQWVRGAAFPPPARCVEIELVTKGLVTRRDLRPDDWQQIWPELVWLDAWVQWIGAQRNPRATARQLLRCCAQWLAAGSR